jgi:hypothetical protein
VDIIEICLRIIDIICQLVNDSAHDSAHKRVTNDQYNTKLPSQNYTRLKLETACIYKPDSTHVLGILTSQHYHLVRNTQSSGRKAAQITYSYPKASLRKAGQVLSQI